MILLILTLTKKTNPSLKLCCLHAYIIHRLFAYLEGNNPVQKIGDTIQSGNSPLILKLNTVKKCGILSKVLKNINYQLIYKSFVYFD